MAFIKVSRELWRACRTHYPFALAAVAAGWMFSAVAFLARGITGAEFVALCGFFVLLGPVMIVARELRGGGSPLSGWAG